ncbi:MAG: DUF3253 domain-containing protein [Rhodobacterales bacterium CG15_BIG_FIL_POST_REV_8_21_14_020_59_13]|nr:MAG: DUF3253 domain-containing protein [Rhodobacterales bacterium CG15_BIG_FIL_POST_REV_8_21_14_020_59_13]
MNDDTVDTAILSLVEARGAGKSISPADAAQALDAENWRRRLSAVKQGAIRLAEAGKVDILRKGKPVNSSDFKGVYRIALKA